MVERSLSMREVPGSIPRISNPFYISDLWNEQQSVPFCWSCVLIQSSYCKFKAKICYPCFLTFKDLEMVPMWWWEGSLQLVLEWESTTAVGLCQALGTFLDKKVDLGIVAQKACENVAQPLQLLYPLDISIKEKIGAIAWSYGAIGVEYTEQVKKFMPCSSNQLSFA
ncbi:uncharacterized protein LOC123224946 [Mangifera indica]|uniref:uncharacterized protein LOC123224946 n=1 Tax=Mangifera indica TaxID=29780 RepID=UPI001CF985B7|nr:uncharacterized protein LOC123224946 [Mangifera indica]